MHNENNDFMHGRKIKGKMRWIVVQFYKFEFVLA
jgi:hypothetical protein